MVSTLHQNKILYRDLKAENLVLNKQTGELTLVDFGFAKLLKSKVGRTNTRCGTPGYSAPEVLL